VVEADHLDRQRAAIARTLATRPDILLMDEPFNSLDALTREELQDLVLQLSTEGRLTMVLVTHSVEEAAFLGRKILILTHPPITCPEVVHNPGAGHVDYRTVPAFYETAQHIRQRIMEMHRDPVAPV
jgi:NitT/TauT family transport system ATP-binding protein